MDDFLSRKFIFAVLLVVLGFILVLMDKASSDSWLASIQVIGGTYVLGNVGEKWVEKK